MCTRDALEVIEGAERVGGKRGQFELYQDTGLQSEHTAKILVNCGSVIINNTCNSTCFTSFSFTHYRRFRGKNYFEKSTHSFLGKN